MAKYIIDIPDEVIELMDGHIRVFIEPEFKMGDCKYYALRLSKEDIEPYTEPDHKAIELQHAHDIENVARLNYNKGAEDGWDLAKLFALTSEDGGMSINELLECFGYYNRRAIFRSNSYQEAKAKYDAWKKKKNEIRVGDEVIPMDTEYDTMIVTRTWKDDYWIDCVNTIGFDGSICSFLTSNVKKTGRHFDEVEELLKKINEVQHDE